MTKPRPPLTAHRAMGRIADFIGWDVCADIIDKSESMTRKLGDPDTGREISLRDAIRLDTAYLKAGGAEAPFFECFAARLGIAAAEPSGRTQLLEATSRAAKETGEAVGAALDAATCESPASQRRAIKEAEEAVEAMVSLLRRLQQGNDD